MQYSINKKYAGKIMTKTLLTLTFLSLLTTSATAEQNDPLEMYEHMRTALVGDWKLSPADKQIGTTSYKSKYLTSIVNTDKTGTTYKLIGFGSTLQEDLLPDTEKQMVTMYHCDDYIDCTQVLATHYCSKMNQPQFIMDLNASTKEKLVFNCNMETKLCNSDEDHVHTIIFDFTDNGNDLKASYLGWTNQKPNKENSIYHFDKK